MLRNCLLLCHSSDVHLLTQMVYFSRDSYVNICIPRNSWKGLANQLSVNGLMSSCMIHSQRTLGKHTKLMQELLVNSRGFSFSWNTQSTGFQSVHFGTDPCFVMLEACLHTESFLDKYCPGTSKSVCI